MRIRIYNAFASNNSGSYTIVGSFGDAATADEVARLIEDVSVTHHAWHEEHPWEDDGESPLDVFVREHALRARKPGRQDEWPGGYDERPTAVSVGAQVVVHARFTVTLSAVFGELFYAKGGRVEIEIDHAHHDIAIAIEYFAPHTESKERSDAIVDLFEARLKEALPSWMERSEHDSRPPVEPAWRRDSWGTRSVCVVLPKVAEGLLAVRALARETGAQVRLRLWECPEETGDPFALMRASQMPWGQFRLILWSVGDRVAAMRAVREALGSDLEGAKAALEDLPAEICTNVDERYAKAAATLLRAAGCNVEVVLPFSRDDEG